MKPTQGPFPHWERTLNHLTIFLLNIIKEVIRSILKGLTPKEFKDSRQFNTLNLKEDPASTVKITLNPNWTTKELSLPRCSPKEGGRE